MTGGGGSGDPPPLSQPSTTADGEFLLRLLHSRFHENPSPSPLHHHHQPHNLSLDPAVAAVGPSLPVNHPHSHHNNHRHPSLSPPSQNPTFFLPHQFPPHQQQQQQQPNNPRWAHHHAPSPPSFYTAPHQHFRKQTPAPASKVVFGNIPIASSGSSSSDIDNINVNRNLGFEQDCDLFEKPHLGSNLGSRMRNGSDLDSRIDPRFESGRGGPPLGFSVPNSNQRRSLGDLNNVIRDMSSGNEFGGGLPPGISMPNQRRSLEDLNNVIREMSSGGSSSELGGSHRRLPSRDDGVGVLGRGSLSGQLDHLGFNSGNDNAIHYEREREFSSRDIGVGVGAGVVGGGRLSGQLDRPGLPAGSSHRSVLSSDIERSLKVLHGGEGANGVGQDEIDELSEQLVGSVLGEESADGKGEINATKKHHRDKDFRSDVRGKWILPQRMRNSKRLIGCRRDIRRLSAPLLAIYESLIPPKEEKAKQKQLMSLLNKLVSKEWPSAKLYLYGSCANSFGVSKSDIDVCLAIDDQDINKSEILLKLADILEADHLENVQALTRARVPIVKLMDPMTGISCDICINNVLAVVNTKLLRDYAEIDERLRQLAFLVKHWAKSRGVNETYQGTLSSYAYVLMCIHFLQQRNPPILPCLQGMKPSYSVTINDIECAFFDQVEKLRNFGARNKESIAELMWGFFGYWAYGHDYTNSVVSVRTGSIISKHEKDWTRRVGNDRHLICIEDPFETSHDLGRVVDKHSIRVLREEFERAANIMQYDPNPCVVLFEPYIPPG